MIIEFLRGQISQNVLKLITILLQACCVLATSYFLIHPYCVYKPTAGRGEGSRKRSALALR